MLESAVVSICAAIGFEMEERWAISVFRVQEQTLRRLAGVRAERLAEQGQARTWRSNEGLVGVAWHTGRDGIIEDYEDPKVAEDYPVSDGQRRAYDAQRYRSMAAIIAPWPPFPFAWARIRRYGVSWPHPVIASAASEEIPVTADRKLSTRYA